MNKRQTFVRDIRIQSLINTVPIWPKLDTNTVLKKKNYTSLNCQNRRKISVGIIEEIRD